MFWAVSENGLDRYRRYLSIALVYFFRRYTYQLYHYDLKYNSKNTIQY